MDTLWMLDLSTINDLEKPDHVQNKTCTWHTKQTSGNGPGKLAHHTSVVIDDVMYIYGGSSQTHENRTLYMLHMDGFDWKQVKTSGEDPGSLDEHTCIAY